MYKLLFLNETAAKMPEIYLGALNRMFPGGVEVVEKAVSSYGSAQKIIKEKVRDKYEDIIFASDEFGQHDAVAIRLALLGCPVLLAVAKRGVPKAAADWDENNEYYRFIGFRRLEIHHGKYPEENRTINKQIIPGANRQSGD